MIIGKTGCGLQYAVKKGGSAVAYCALSIRCGTRDEKGFPNGIAHFTEHTVFKGTRHKSAATINGYLDRLGGELNAYTTKEEIVFHATVLKEDLPKAAALLLELATDASFPEEEIRRGWSSTRSNRTKTVLRTMCTTVSKRPCLPVIRFHRPSWAPSEA